MEPVQRLQAISQTALVTLPPLPIMNRNRLLIPVLSAQPTTLYSNAETLNRSEGQEVTDARPHPERSEHVKAKNAPSHQIQSESDTAVQRKISSSLSVPTADNTADRNMFPRASNGIRKELKGVLMVKETHRVFKDLAFGKTT
jgi:hypothetical protein